jgi:hypothetical protein
VWIPWHGVCFQGLGRCSIVGTTSYLLLVIGNRHYLHNLPFRAKVRYHFTALSKILSY